MKSGHHDFGWRVLRTGKDGVIMSPGSFERVVLTREFPVYNGEREIRSLALHIDRPKISVMNTSSTKRFES